MTVSPPRASVLARVAAIVVICAVAAQEFIGAQWRVFTLPRLQETGAELTPTLPMWIAAAVVVIAAVVMVVGSLRSGWKAGVAAYAGVSLLAAVLVYGIDLVAGTVAGGNTVVSLAIHDVLLLVVAYCAGVVVWGRRPGQVIAARFASLFLLAGAGILGAWSFTHLGSIDQPVFAHIIFTVTLIVAVIMGASEDQNWISGVAGVQGVLGAAALISSSWGPVLHATFAMILAGCLGIAWAQEYVMPQNRPWSPLDDEDEDTADDITDSESE